MHRYALVAALVLAAVALPAPLAAQTHRDVITGQLDMAASFMGRQGFIPDTMATGRSPIVGLLPAGGVVYLEVVLEENREYVVNGACDSDCEDLDLRIMDETGETVVEDVEVDNVPVLEFVPQTNQRYMLGVGMSKCTTEACFFGFQVLKKPAPTT